MWGGKLCSVLVLAVMPLSFVSTAWGETYYRWTDDRGNPVHSDRPPPKGVDYEVVSTGTSMKRMVEAEQGAVPPEVEPSVGNDFERVDPEEEKLRKSKNAEYCQRARDNLNALSTSARIRVRSSDGEFRFLNEEEKAARRQEAEEAITTYCD